MSIYCSSYAQACSEQCCNIYSNCPSVEHTCYFYYNGTYGSATNTTSTESSLINSGAIAGIAVGTVLLIVVVSIAWWYCKRSRPESGEAMTNQIINQATTMQMVSLMIPTEADQSLSQALYTFPQEEQQKQEQQKEVGGQHQLQPIEQHLSEPQQQHPTYNLQNTTPQEYALPTLRPVEPVQQPTVIFSG